MYRFLLTRRWLVGHVVVASVVVGCVGLGFWQLSRYRAQSEFNDLLEARMTIDPVALPESGLAAEAHEYSRVVAEGRFDADGQVILRPRARNGVPGHHLITPLILGDGTKAILVDRGWVPAEQADPTVVDPTSGTVQVTGILLDSESPSRFGTQNPSEGELSTIFRIDIPRLESQYPYELVPLYLSLAQQDPPRPGSLPEPPLPPQLSDRSHLSYTVQWWSFAVIGIVGYGALIRKARGRLPETEQDAPLSADLPI